MSTQGIAGMEVADALNAEYGETSGGGIRAGKQGPLFDIGNRYLDESFPHLDSIIRASIEEDAKTVRSMSGSAVRSADRWSAVSPTAWSAEVPQASGLRHSRPGGLRYDSIVPACFEVCGGAYSLSNSRREPE